MTDRRKYLAVTALLVAALVAIGLLAVPGSPFQRKPTLGLDLQGGLEVVRGSLTGSPSRNAAVKACPDGSRSKAGGEGARSSGFPRVN